MWSPILNLCVLIFDVLFSYCVYCDRYTPEYRHRFLVCENLLGNKPDSDSNISCSDVLNLQYNLFSVSAGRVTALLQSEACRSAPPLWPERDSIGWRGSRILDGEQSQEPKRPQIERFFVVLLFVFRTSSEPSDLQLLMTEADVHVKTKILNMLEKKIPVLSMNVILWLNFHWSVFSRL